jgi:Flp pilus assembly protein TadB
VSRSRDRGLIWLVAIAGAIALAVAFAGIKGWVTPPLGMVSAGLFVICLLLVAVIGWQRHRQTLVDRETAARGQMIVMIAARLKTQDDEALEAMAARGALPGRPRGWCSRGARNGPGARPVADRPTR